MNPRESYQLIQRDPLVSFFDKRVLSSPEPPSDAPVRQPRLDETEIFPVRGENQRFRQTGEGGVGFENYELGHVRVELFPADGEHVDLVAEEHGVEDASRRVAVAPAVEGAEGLHGDVDVVVVGDGLEGFGR